MLKAQLRGYRVQLTDDRSIKHECLDRLIPVGERHLRRSVAEYLAHYHHERNHQGIGNELIVREASFVRSGPIRRRQRIGGIKNTRAGLG